MIHILARITVKPNAAVATRDILKTLAQASRAEPGCISYHLFQRSNAPHEFQTVEQWLDKTAANAHMTTAHVASALAAAGPLFAAAPDIESYELVSQ